MMSNSLNRELKLAMAGILPTAISYLQLLANIRCDKMECLLKIPFACARAPHSRVGHTQKHLPQR